MKITNQMLIDYGMVETQGGEHDIHPWKKVITSDHIENPEAGEMAIVLDNSYNEWHFALCLPDDSMLHLRHFSDMEELKAFERMIISYEPNY